MKTAGFPGTPFRSNRFVPVGIAPFNGISETGMESPFRRRIGCMILFAKSPASAGTSWAMSSHLSNSEGMCTSITAFADSSIAFQFISTISLPLRRKVFSTYSFIMEIASASGTTPASLKKAVCITELILLPKPTAFAIFAASMAYTLIFFFTIVSCMSFVRRR